eukprot:TRINITY_DN5248_c0_g1_i1.p1 TRINITY_DN5248_c0_g1~~TRINITY_DN5248_c0_g1_i1.p1  ORF type:complete len:484 (+),score=80.40 TRINITY_DN5248_c0_g1_i1:99-1550(+)
MGAGLGGALGACPAADCYDVKKNSSARFTVDFDSTVVPVLPAGQSNAGGHWEFHSSPAEDSVILPERVREAMDLPTLLPRRDLPSVDRRPDQMQLARSPKELCNGLTPASPKSPQMCPSQPSVSQLHHSIAYLPAFVENGTNGCSQEAVPPAGSKLLSSEGLYGQGGLPWSPTTATESHRSTASQGTSASTSSQVAGSTQCASEAGYAGYVEAMEDRASPNSGPAYTRRHTRSKSFGADSGKASRRSKKAALQSSRTSRSSLSDVCTDEPRLVENTMAAKTEKRSRHPLVPPVDLSKLNAPAQRSGACSKVESQQPTLSTDSPSQAEPLGFVAGPVSKHKGKHFSAEEQHHKEDTLSFHAGAVPKGRAEPSLAPKDPFLVAHQAAKSLKNVETSKRLKLHALFKQATAGPASGSRPSVFEPSERAKWDAWAKLKSMDRRTAKREYCALVSELLPSWRAGLAEKYTANGAYMMTIIKDSACLDV